MGMVNEAHNKKEEEPVQAVLSQSERPSPCNKICINTSAKKKQHRVRVIHSLLCGVEAPVLRPDPLSREACCLSAA